MAQDCNGPIRPTYCEIVQRSGLLANRYSDRVSYSEIGPSAEGRPIPVLSFGDADRDLPLMMVTGGMHGSEETGRAASLALAEWLATEGADHLARLSVVVVPCLNPDGTERNSYHNAQDINLYKSFRHDAPSTAVEGRAAEELALRLQPDCYADVHGLAGGYMGDSEYVTPTLPGNMGLQIGFAIAAEMDAAAVAAGLPQAHPWIESRFLSEAGCLCDKLAALLNSLCYTVEITENYYPLEDSVRSGLLRLRKLVEVGQRTHYNQPYPGFPCDTLVGGPMFAVMPFGAGYRQRRESRLRTMGILRAMREETDFVRFYGDPGHTATLRLIVHDLPQGAPEGLVMQLALDPRAAVTRVCYQWPGGEEEELQPAALGEPHGYAQWTQGVPMVRVSVARPPRLGAHKVIVKYDAPYQPHMPQARCLE